jgi:HEAT repeat protein
VLAVRGVALELAATGWPTDERVQEIVQQLCRDPDPDLRTHAVMVMAYGLMNTPWALPLLRDIATTDGEAAVRTTAIRTMISAERGSLELRAFLLSRLREDHSPAVRAAAIANLAVQWPQQPETVPLVLNAVRHDPDPTVRAVCIIIIAGAHLAPTLFRPETEPSYEHLFYSNIHPDDYYQLIDHHWWLQPDVGERIYDSASSDTDAGVRSIAIRALVGVLWERPGEMGRVLANLLQGERDDAVLNQLRAYETWLRDELADDA